MCIGFIICVMSSEKAGDQAPQIELQFYESKLGRLANIETWCPVEEELKVMKFLLGLDPLLIFQHLFFTDFINF